MASCCSLCPLALTSYTGTFTASMAERAFRFCSAAGKWREYLVIKHKTIHSTVAILITSIQVSMKMFWIRIEAMEFSLSMFSEMLRIRNHSDYRGNCEKSCNLGLPWHVAERLCASFNGDIRWDKWTDDVVSGIC